MLAFFSFFSSSSLASLRCSAEFGLMYSVGFQARGGGVAARPVRRPGAAVDDPALLELHGVRLGVALRVAELGDVEQGGGELRGDLGGVGAFDLHLALPLHHFLGPDDLVTSREVLVHEHLRLAPVVGRPGVRVLGQADDAEILVLIDVANFLRRRATGEGAQEQQASNRTHGILPCKMAADGATPAETTG